jgi:putative ABC transport system permease protein
MHVGNPKKGPPWATVVGVVADARFGPRDEPGIAPWYVPAPQPAILFGPQTSGTLIDAAGGCITLRSALPPEQMTQTLRSAIAEIDRLLALQQV